MQKQQNTRRSYALIAAVILCIMTVFTISGAAYEFEFEDYYQRHEFMVAPPREKLWVLTGASDFRQMNEDEYLQLRTASFQIYNVSHEYDGGGYGASGSVVIARPNSPWDTFGGLWIIDSPHATLNDGFEIRYVPDVALLDFCVDECCYRIYTSDDLEHPVSYANMDASIYVVEDDPSSSHLVLANPDFLDVELCDACEDAWGYRPYFIGYATFETGLMGSFSAGYAEGWDQGWIDGNTQGYDLGHEEGYRLGETDALNGNETLKDLIFAIFGAPIELINGMLDFDLFGINVASLVKTLLTLSITALIVWVIIKLVKG